jgi:hypothetical protein
VNVIQEANLFAKDIVETLSAELRCEQCGEPIPAKDRQHGSPQRFCGSKCRKAFHKASPNSETLRTNLPAVIEPKPKSEDGGGLCWAVPHQRRIECWATNDDEIEIEEYSERGESDNVRICVARCNAVRLARSILYATGFKGVLIATGAKGGYCDVEDGGLPEHFN